MKRCMIFCLALLVSVSAFAEKITVYRAGQEVLIQSRWSDVGATFDQIAGFVCKTVNIEDNVQFIRPAALD